MDHPKSRSILPVIISGGSGTRLWPLSTDEAPKQFHALGGTLTLIQETARRFQGDGRPHFQAPMVVCGVRHEPLVRDQLARIGAGPSLIVVEPVGRGTAAVAVIAARLARERHPDAIVLLAPADHLIADPGAFRAAVARGAEVTGRIVAFGVEPTRPETGYGYIQLGAAIGETVFEVSRFVEKPSSDVAEGYLRAGGYLWNAGVFLFEPGVMLAEMRAWRPDILAAVDATLEARTVDGDRITLPEKLFAAVPTESLDVAVMERTRQAAVATLDAGWGDLGAWNEVWRLGEHDGGGNLLHGDALALETTDSLVWSDGRPVVTLGIQDLVVVSTKAAVIVLPRSRSQDLGRIVEAVRAGRAAGGRKDA